MGLSGVSTVCRAFSAFVIYKYFTGRLFETLYSISSRNSIDSFVGILGTHFLSSSKGCDLSLSFILMFQMGHSSRGLSCPLTCPCCPSFPLPGTAPCPGSCRTVPRSALDAALSLGSPGHSCSLEARITGVRCAHSYWSGNGVCVCVYTSKGMDVHMDTRAHLVCIAVSLGLLKSSTLSFSLALRGFLLVFFFFLYQT